MNYKAIYEKLISKRQNEPAIGYTEIHHILPRCLGGSDDIENLVRLTGREHWVAHLLLYKIHRTANLVHACNMMAMRCEERGIPRIKSSRMYEYIRKEHAKAMRSLMSIAQRGKGNSQYGTMWICNIDLLQNKKISKDNDIPTDWVKGRNKWNEIERNVILTKKCICGSTIKTTHNRKKYCSKACANQASLNICNTKIIKNNIIKTISRKNLGAYRKIGWQII